MHMKYYTYGGKGFVQEKGGESEMGERRGETAELGSSFVLVVIKLSSKHDGPSV